MKSLYSLALHLYPRAFRERFGHEMQQVFDAGLKHTSNRAHFLIRCVCDLITSSLEERFHSMSFDRMLRRFAIPLAAVALLGLSTTMIQAYFISGPSMAGTLEVGDCILVNKLARTPQFGEMVVFRYPVDPNEVFIKRVIGMPGDRIRLENKQVIRNGKPIDEAYAEHRTAYVDAYRDNFPSKPQVTLPEPGERMLKDSLAQGDIVVPPGMFFVLGDNRDISLDSRFWGFVPQANVIGHPWLVYWSRDAQSHAMRWDRMPLLLHD